MKLRPTKLYWILATFVALAVPASAASDTWLTTKTKLALLTADVSITGVSVDTKDGVVTLHGKVKTEDAKRRAERAAKEVEGTKDVRNLIQVVPESVEDRVQVADDAIEKKVKASLKTASDLQDVKVASVNDGVVLLEGKTSTLDQKLKAVEKAWEVEGVRRVSAKIETGKE